MPDSLLTPPSGFAPFDDRDLDAVLAGETDVQDALRPVAEALAALRAAPAPAELRGEGNALAEFRALRAGERARHAAPAQTLLLRALPPDSAPRQAARRRGRRRAPRTVSRRPGVLTAIAAAAAIVIIGVFSVNLPGPISRLAHKASSPDAATASVPPQGHSASPGVEAGSASPEPTATHSAAPSPSATCRAYYGYLEHPGTSSRSAEASLWNRLTELAGGKNLYQVDEYCAKYVTGLSQYWTPPRGQYQPAAPGGGHPGSADQGNQGNQDDNQGSGQQQGGPGAGSAGRQNGLSGSFGR